MDAILRALEGLDVVVVTGHDATRIAEFASCRTVFNPSYADGIGTSIAAGVRASDGALGFLIVHADMPELRSEVVRSITSEAASDRIVAPVYEHEPERLGHPVFFGRNFRAELLALDGDSGARDILQRHASAVHRVQVPGRLDDVDTPEAYERLTRGS